jgi:hypothetical protein
LIAPMSFFCVASWVDMFSSVFQFLNCFFTSMHLGCLTVHCDFNCNDYIIHFYKF